MNNTRLAIVAIVIVIPMTSIFVLNNTSNAVEKIEATGTKKVRVFTSFYPLYEFTKMIGGDKVEVFPLIQGAVEPHDWEPSIQDIQKMGSADLIIINGLGFEKWAGELMSSNPNIVYVDSSVGVEPLQIDSEDVIAKKDSKVDPHIWLNPNTITIQIQNIADALKLVDQTNAEIYQKNSDLYKSKFKEMDKTIKQEFENCRKDFIAFHNAFAYFANEYGLIQHTIVSDPNSEPTPQSLHNIIKLSKDKKLKIIFTEEAINPKISKTMANEIGGKVLLLSPLEIQDNNKTFVERMNENIANLKEALCT